MSNQLFGGKNSGNGKVKKNKDGFFLTIEEDAEEAAIEEAAIEEAAIEEKPASQPQVNGTTATETTDTPTDIVLDKTTITPESKEKQAEKKPESATKASKGKKTKSVPQSSPVGEWDGPDWAKELLKSSKNSTNGKTEEKEPEKEGMTFATNYLMPSITRTRRRPGPSMNMFMDMARKVNTK